MGTIYTLVAGMITVDTVQIRKLFVRYHKFNKVICFLAKTMGLLPDRRCVYSDDLTHIARPYLRTSVSNLIFLGQMKAVMEALRVVTCPMPMTNGLAAVLERTQMIMPERDGGPVGRDRSTKRS